MRSVKLLTVAVASTATATEAPGSISWVKGAGDICSGSLHPCTSAAECTSAYLGPCDNAGPGAPTEYIQMSTERMAIVDEANYLSCAHGDPTPACEHAVVIDSSGNGYRDFSEKVEVGGGSYAFNMAGNLFGETWGAYFGSASYFNSGSTNIATPTMQVYSAHPNVTANVTRGGSMDGAPLGPYDICVADGTNGTCTGKETFAPGAFYSTIFGYTYEDAAGEFATNFAAAKPPAATHVGVRQAVTLIGSAAEQVKFNNGAHTLDTLGNTDVSDIDIENSKGHVHIKFGTGFNYGGIDHGGGPTLEGQKPIKIKVFHKPTAPNTLYVDYLFETDEAADKYFIHGTHITAALKPPALDHTSIAWVKAASGDTCIGAISPCDSKATCTSVFAGPCNSAAEGAPAYVMQSVGAMAIVDAAQYLSCSDINMCEHATIIQGTGTGYRDLAGEKAAGNTTFAYSMSGNLFGEDWGAYVGAAAYFNTGTDTILTNENDFFVATLDNAARVERDDSKIGAPSGPHKTCIADGSSGTCVGTRTFPPGAYKFSVFGYTYEKAVDHFKDSYASAVAAGQLPAGTHHIGVRTLLTAKGFDPTGITFNNMNADGTPSSAAPLTLETLGNTTITDFMMSTPNGPVTYKFPTMYNYGTVSAASDETQMPLLGGGNIKIKVSVAAEVTNTLYVDYLVPVGTPGAANSLTVAGNYFVYDPEVTSTANEALKNPTTPAKPCFPGDATAVRESGAVARLDQLKAGDKIKATDASGALYYDEVSRFSYADYDAEATFVTLATAKKTLTLTAEHRVPVGAACCSNLKKAKDVSVGETLWLAAAEMAAPAVVTKVGSALGAGVHNPLMKHGGFPVVDGVVTAFESVGVVKFASLTIPLVEAACEATGTCALVEQLWSLLDGKFGSRPIIGGVAAGGLTGLVLATGLAAGALAAGARRASKAASL